MHFSQALIATVAAVAPLTSAHGSGIPRIIGLPVHGQARDLLHKIEARVADFGHAHGASLVTRQDKPECGPGVGSCKKGECCSRSGFCGTTGDYCYSPGCKYEFGPACAENNPPAGTNTSSIDRAKIGNLTYGGTGIFQCVKPGTVALTYDDGPQKKFTSHILDLFKSYNAKATFFVTGNNINKGQIDVEPEYIEVVKRMDAEKHQIASHTWTHLDLSAISSLDRKNQLWMNEMAIRNIIGKIPTYMRPPYSSCNASSGCEQDMADLGYHVTYFKVDTDDYNKNSPELIQKAKDNFLLGITNNSAKASTDKHLAITHDILEQTANNLTEYMLSELTKLGYKAVTVGECLGDPEANWYRAADGYGNSTELNIKNNATSQGTGSGNSNANNSQAGDGTAGTSQNTPGAANHGFSSLGPAAVAGLVLLVSMFATIF